MTGKAVSVHVGPSMDRVVYQLDGPFQLSQKRSEIQTESLGENDVVGKTEFSVVSPGTEIAAWNGQPPLRPSKVYPRLVGYCNLAKVVKTGRSVSSVEVGDFILTHQSHCSAFVCPQEDVLLRTSEQDAQARKKLAATYLYHLGYTALLTGGFRPGHYVGVVGCGALGLCTASLVKAFGSQPIIFSDQDVSEAPFSRMGFRYILKKNVDLSGMVAEIPLVDGGVDIVVNTANSWADYLLALKILRKGGEMVCMGFPGRGEPPPDFNPLDPQYFYDKQLTIRHCGYASRLEVNAIDIRFTIKRNMRFLSTLINDGEVDPMSILNVESPWPDLARVYETLSSRKPGIYSALLDWRT
jgi:D-arabinose 1-dehydrogenase-like Zn-dependent alcohol dehydrogenase